MQAIHRSTPLQGERPSSVNSSLQTLHVNIASTPHSRVLPKSPWRHSAPEWELARLGESLLGTSLRCRGNGGGSCFHCSSSSFPAVPPCLSVGWRSVVGPGPSTPLDVTVQRVSGGCLKIRSSSVTRSFRSTLGLWC